MPAVPCVGMQAVGRSIWPAGLALFLSVSTSILVFPFFPYIPSSGYFGVALPQVNKSTSACHLDMHFCTMHVTLFKQLATLPTV